MVDKLRGLMVRIRRDIQFENTTLWPGGSAFRVSGIWTYLVSVFYEYTIPVV